MGSEIVQLVEQASPYLTSAVTAYGAAVLTRAENAAADASANVGWRIFQAVWNRRSGQARSEFEAAVLEAADTPNDADTVAALRQQIKRALNGNAALFNELTQILPASRNTVYVKASGERSIAAKTISTAITGDNTAIRP